MEIKLDLSARQLWFLMLAAGDARSVVIPILPAQLDDSIFTADYGISQKDMAAELDDLLTKLKLAGEGKSYTNDTVLRSKKLEPNRCMFELSIIGGSVLILLHDVDDQDCVDIDYTVDSDQFNKEFTRTDAPEEEGRFFLSHNEFKLNYKMSEDEVKIKLLSLGMKQI